MKSFLARFLKFVLVIAFMMMSSHVSAQDIPQGEKAPPAQAEAPAVLPQLADVIPLASELTIRLSLLESEMKDIPDVSTAAMKYEEIQAKIDGLAEEAQQLKDTKDYTQNRFVSIGEAIKEASESFEEASEPIKKGIRRLGDFREEWLAEKKRWSEWQEGLIQETGLDQLASTFDKANNTIETALGLILPQLEAMFRIQEKGGAIDARLRILDHELDGIVAEERRGTLFEEIPPMLSPRFFSQLTSGDLWSAAQRGLHEISWPGSRLFTQQGWIILLQVFVSIFVIIAIYRNQASLKESERWRFLAERIVSAGLFLGYMTTALIYESQGAPVILKQALSIVAAISFARLFAGLTEAPWKREFVYGLMILLVVRRLMETFGFPLPLLRLYTIATALAALIFCLRWARESVRVKESKVYPWVLRLGSLFFAVIVIAELQGKASLPSYLLTSFMRSAATVLLFTLFMYMMRGGLEWLFRSSPMRRTSSLYSNTDALVKRIGLFIDIAIWGFVVVPAVFVIWRAYDNLGEAVKGLLNLGFDLGAQRISLGLLITAAAFVYSSFLLSWILQNLLVDKVLVRRGAEMGVRVSTKKLVHYVIISFGFLLALSALGLELTQLTIMLSALGVGIGFGLQGIVNNLVSGLILLFERPVRVGDYIEASGTWCEIQKIGLRATTVQTFDQADVIIPNADLVANQVTNWTLRNRRARLIIPVGVAYGSDIPLVIETLKASAEPHPMVAKSPAPQVLFLNFGESSLDLELRVWVLDVDQMMTARSELHQEIDRRFREANIEIAFPQRDLRFRSMDESIRLVPSGTAEAF